MLSDRIDSYVCIDIETTGLNPKTDKMIEIGAVKIEKGVRTGVYESLVNPGRRLEDKIKELTGISERELLEAPDISQVLEEVLVFIGDSMLLGHSILFDYSFLKKAAVNQRLTFEKEGIDTLKIARKYLPDLKSRRLDYLCGYYHIPHTAHRALPDAQAAGLLYEKLADSFLTEDSKADFMPHKLIYQAKREQPASKFQKERLYKLLVQHKLLQDLDLDKLTRNEASRYTDQILARFGR